MALDSKTNHAVLGSSQGCYGCPAKIGLVDLATGAQTTFPGFGFVNCIAVAFSEWHCLYHDRR